MYLSACTIAIVSPAMFVCLSVRFISTTTTSVTCWWPPTRPLTSSCIAYSVDSFVVVCTPAVVLRNLPHGGPRQLPPNSTLCVIPALPPPLLLPATLAKFRSFSSRRRNQTWSLQSLSHPLEDQTEFRRRIRQRKVAFRNKLIFVRMTSSMTNIRQLLSSIKPWRKLAVPTKTGF